jgi:hypothetical protein
MQIKTTRRHWWNCYKSTRIVWIQRTTCWWGCGWTESPHSAGGMYNGVPTLRTVWHFLINIHFPSGWQFHSQISTQEKSKYIHAKPRHKFS